MQFKSVLASKLIGIIDLSSASRLAPTSLLSESRQWTYAAGLPGLTEE